MRTQERANVDATLAEIVFIDIVRNNLKLNAKGRLLAKKKETAKWTKLTVDTSI